MSLTIAPEHRESDVAGFALTCDCGKTRTGQVATAWADASALVETTTLSCTDDYCSAIGMVHVDTVMAVEVPSVNMAYGNARPVLEALGIDMNEAMSWGGSEDAETFLGRVLLAQAINPADAGRPAAEAVGTGARMIDCGRAPGYVDDRLDSLRTIAEWAIADGRQITWG